MANTAQTRKRARQTVKQRAHNTGLRSTLRTAIKKIKLAIAGGDSKVAKKAFDENISVIDRIADKKIVHKNKAAFLLYGLAGRWQFYECQAFR